MKNLTNKFDKEQEFTLTASTLNKIYASAYWQGFTHAAIGVTAIAGIIFYIFYLKF